MLTGTDFESIYNAIDKRVAQKGEYVLMSKVIKADPINNLIWLAECGDQPIPMFDFNRSVRYYDTQLQAPVVTVSYELNYKEKNSNTSITATTSATANTIITFDSITFDGTQQIYARFATPAIALSGAVGEFVLLALKDTTAGTVGPVFTQVGMSTNSSTEAIQAGFLGETHKITPPSGARVYSIVGWAASAGPSTVSGGAGTSAAYMPAHGRLLRVDPLVTVTIPSTVIEKTAKSDPLIPKVDDIALVVMERGTIRLPRCIGLLQSKNFVVTTLDEA